MTNVKPCIGAWKRLNSVPKMVYLFESSHFKKGQSTQMFQTEICVKSRGR
jgi:hypothetical protein